MATSASLSNVSKVHVAEDLIKQFFYQMQKSWKRVDQTDCKLRDRCGSVLTLDWKEFTRSTVNLVSRECNLTLHFTHKLVAMVTDFTLPDFEEVTSICQGNNFNPT